MTWFCFAPSSKAAATSERWPVSKSKTLSTTAGEDRGRRGDLNPAKFLIDEAGRRVAVAECPGCLEPWRPVEPTELAELGGRELEAVDEAVECCRPASNRVRMPLQVGEKLAQGVKS